VENFDAIVASVADEQAAARVHRQRVRLIPVLRARSFLSELLEELAIFVELNEARICAPVSFTNPDLPIGRDQHIVRLIERVGFGRRTWLIATGFAQGHQQLPVRAELENLMADNL